MDSVWKAGLAYCLLSGKEEKSFFTLGVLHKDLFPPTTTEEKLQNFCLIHDSAPQSHFPEPLRNNSPVCPNFRCAPL